MTIKTITLPKKLVANSLFEIISKFNFVFQTQNKQRPNFYLNLEKIREVDIIGMLILYKFIEYSSEKKCFTNPQINKPKKAPINKFINLYGFEDLINAYIKNKDLNKMLSNLKIEKTEEFLIAPQVLIRNNKKSKKDFDIKFKDVLESFYGLESKIVIESILTCAVEISSNFYNHAKDDTKSLILARGTKSSIEIACADTADGLLNTLRELEKYVKYTNKSLMKKAFEQGVTSKPDSYHMGYGLWLVKEIVIRCKGTLEVFSSDTFFSTKFGEKETIEESPFWKGTIVYLKLPIKNIATEIGEILRISRKKNSIFIKINFS